MYQIKVDVHSIHGLADNSKPKYKTPPHYNTRVRQYNRTYYRECQAQSHIFHIGVNSAIHER